MDPWGGFLCNDLGVQRTVAGRFRQFGYNGVNWKRLIHDHNLGARTQFNSGGSPIVGILHVPRHLLPNFDLRFLGVYPNVRAFVFDEVVTRQLQAFSRGFGERMGFLNAGLQSIRLKIQLIHSGSDAGIDIGRTGRETVSGSSNLVSSAGLGISGSYDLLHLFRSTSIVAPGLYELSYRSQCDNRSEYDHPQFTSPDSIKNILLAGLCWLISLAFFVGGLVCLIYCDICGPWRWINTLTPANRIGCGIGFILCAVGFDWIAVIHWSTFLNI
jgi:hypothetical protein